MHNDTPIDIVLVLPNHHQWRLVNKWRPTQVWGAFVGLFIFYTASLFRHL